jgi:hypothetical protein
LTSKSFNISNGAAAQITFQTCYEITNDGDQGRVEVNLPGGWMPVPSAAYTGSSNGWGQRDLSMPPVIGSNNLSFRFLLDPNLIGNADGWYVDDVFVKLDYDLDDDGISNAIDAVGDDGVTLYPDTNGDGTPDYIDPDSDGDSIPDSIEGSGDADGDGQSNFRDLNSDDDEMNDATEGSDDSNHNGIPDFLDNPNNPDGDVDGDTIRDSDENIPGRTDADGDHVGNAGDSDSDNDGIEDIEEAGDSDPNTLPIDSDGDGLPDFVDPDSDNDTLPDSEEGPGDIDGDGTPDYRDEDRDGDGIPDGWEDDHDLDPNNDDSNEDPDQDGLSNGEEHNANTDPRDSDTDNDGLLDGEDPTPARAVKDIFLPVITKSK